MKRIRISTGALAFVLVSTMASAQCAPNGLALGFTGGRLGDPFALTLAGTPAASGLLGFDLAPGLIGTPFGAVCLGLTPAFQFQPFTLDPAGQFSISGVAPANPALNGLGVYTQAAAGDPSQPSGFAISNSAHPVLRPPRFFPMDPGFPPWYGQAPVSGSFAIYDALSDSVGPVVPLPSWVASAVVVPQLGWIAMTLGDGSLRAFDCATGAQVLNVQVTTGPVSGPLDIASDGTTIVAAEALAFSSILHVYQLPSGTQVLSAQVPGAADGRGVFIPAGSGTVYVGVASPTMMGYIPVSLSTGSYSAPIALATSAYPMLATSPFMQGATIYALLNIGGSYALNALDTATNTPRFPNPVPTLPGNGICWNISPCDLFIFRYGSGSVGPALFLRSNTMPVLMEISAQTLAPTGASIPLPAGANYAELSNSGTEWLVTSCPTCWSPSNPNPVTTLYSINTSTLATTTIGTISAPSRISVLPSGTLSKAYLFGAGVRVSTNPGSSIVPIPPLGFSPTLTIVD